jgi:recyclin-1
MKKSNSSNYGSSPYVEIGTPKYVLFRKLCFRHQRDYSQATKQALKPTTATPTTRFLGSQNPAQVKRNVLASFTNALLLPVTIVPRTVGAVGAALTTGGTTAVQGIAMLNPQRWGGNMSSRYSRHFDTDDGGDGLSESSVPDDPNEKESHDVRGEYSMFLTL